MNKLMKSNTINSREVAEMVEKEHKDLLRDIRTYVQYLNESNFALVDFFIEASYQDAKGEERPCYGVTKKGCELIANKLTGQKGIIFTAAYVNKFNDMEEQLLPKTYLEALKALVIAEEEKERIASENIELLALNNEMRPKAEFFDDVASSKDAIDMGRTAKVLNMGVGRNTLFELLRDKGILQQNNIPYQKYIDLGYFRVIEQRFNKPDGSIGINIKTLVYQKGLDYIRKIIEKWRN